MTYDVIVIGVGGMGSATVYQLARRKAKVLGLEQFDIPHDFGSSHGVNRIIRLAYYEGSNYVPLLHRAYELWRQVELAADERLLIITGSIDTGTADGNIVKGSLDSCEKHHLEHELLDADQLNRRHPGYRIAKDMLAVYQPDGGFLMSERCIVAHVEVAQTWGAEIKAREKVLNWTMQKEGVRVNTDRASYQARKLVLTAGPWSATLLPQLQAKAVPERQVMIWTQPLRPEFFQPGIFPVFNMEAAEGRFYGFPVYGIPGFKIGKYHHLKQKVEQPSQMDRDIHREDEEVLRAGIRRYFPDADGPTMAMKTCLFTNSPDEHFILDRHPDSGNVCIAAGFSGHGYKFCSVVGEIMADLALEGGTRHEISEFSLKRFDERSGPSSEIG
jgi:sarcosine oxidase